MRTDEIEGALEFLRRAEALKDTLRSSRTSRGRPESTAEHTWRLCLMAVVFADALGGIDIARSLKICLVHDLGEALGGDVSAVVQTEGGGKAERERADLEELARTLRPALRAELLALWGEYEAASSPEGALVKGLDKLETILQHNQGRNPPGWDYGFNLTYGLRHTSAHPLLAEVRAILDAGTRARLGGQG